MRISNILPSFVLPARSILAQDVSYGEALQNILSGNIATNNHDSAISIISRKTA